MNEQIKPRLLLETVADIAYMAGAARYYTGDSRQDIQTFITWAQEFEAGVQIGDGEPSYEGLEYMSAIERFFEKKMTLLNAYTVVGLYPDACTGFPCPRDGSFITTVVAATPMLAAERASAATAEGAYIDADEIAILCVLDGTHDDVLSQCACNIIP